MKGSIVAALVCGGVSFFVPSPVWGWYMLGLLAAGIATIIANMVDAR